MPYFWTFVLIMSVLVEAATAALTTIWFMPAGFICLLLAMFDVSVPVQIASFVVLGGLTLVLSKTIFKKKLGVAGKTATNADRIIGADAVVIVSIDNDLALGEITVKGQHWTARSDDGSKIEKGEKVTVLRIEGVKAIVRA